MKTLHSESGVFPIIGMVMIAAALYICGYYTSEKTLKDDQMPEQQRQAPSHRAQRAQVAMK